LSTDRRPSQEEKISKESNDRNQMKKLLIITSLAITASLSSFGQGYFSFYAPANTVYDDFTTPGTPQPSDRTVEVAFLFGPAGSTLPAMGSGVAINATSAADIWPMVMNLPSGWLIASSGGTPLITRTTSNGGFAVNNGISVAVDGTLPNTVYTEYVIGWNVSYGTILSPVSPSAQGWSNPIQVIASSITGQPTPLNYIQSGGQPFGVAPVPEPGTFALAGLGAVALLIFQRRK
jgi:hypothetical protein